MTRLKLRDGSAVPPIGLTVANGQLTIPEDLDLVFFNYDPGQSFTLTLWDRSGGMVSFAPAGQLKTLPYYPTAGPVAYAGSAVDPLYVRIDGRVIAKASISGGFPYIYLPHDAQTPMG